MGVLGQEISKDHYEIIVVDNDVAGSAKATVQQIETRHKEIRYEKRFSNNVSEARNLGAKIGKGEWIAFLDDDCIPDPDWLSRALRLLQEVNQPGLVFGGGYLVESEAPTTFRSELIYLPKDKYLPEGNCFYRRSEYLSLGGMRPDLGPSDKRFGYHEGSELQGRYLNKYGSEHRRILLHPLDVHHLARKKRKGWLAIVSGYDAAFAFGSSKPKRGISNVVRILGCIVRYILQTIKLSPSGKERELYRMGELFGESALQGKKNHKK